MAEFPDLPEALTYGENEDLALQWARDALYEALDQYMTMRRDLPAPGIVKERGIPVAPPPDAESGTRLTSNAQHC